MSFTLELAQSSESPDSFPVFKIEIEDESGQRRSVKVHFIKGSALADVGTIRDGVICIRRDLPKILIPIIVQMLYFQMIGYEPEDTLSAAINYGNLVLNRPDFANLARLLNAKTNALTTRDGGEGNQEYYLRCLGEYNDRYRRNRYVNRARAYQSAGRSDIADESLVSVGVARNIYDDEGHYRSEHGKRVCVAHPLRELMTDVVFRLDHLAHVLEDKKRDGIWPVTLEISDPLLLRVLYFFTKDFVINSHVTFVKEGAVSSNVRFVRQCDATIRSVISQLRVDLHAEKAAIERVLNAATNVYGQLTPGTPSHARLLLRSQLRDGPDVSIVMREMGNLVKERARVSNSIAGLRPDSAAVPVRKNG
ncbi:hypothetical protein HZC07_05055 [Candidatus Micrarchaeota archaeon]|nr:hypothetical protein [Candidatus Micrarchaeota archaeon]